MKRIISLCLSLCVIISSFMFTTADAADLKRTDISKQGGLLRTIGIINSVADEAEGNGRMSRAEFAVMLGKMLGMEVSEENTRYFTDIPMTHWAVSYVNKLVDMNIISVSDDKLFRPNDKITLNEAVKMIISSLGYAELAECIGGFPSGYTQIAAELDFTLPGGNSAMTVYQSYILVYDALKSETYDITSVEKGNIVYNGSGKTFLSEYYDIYEADGIVIQTSGISVDGKLLKGSSNDKTAKIIRIDDEQYTSDIDFYDYLGRRTHVYYHQEDNDTEKTIVYREDSKKREQVTDIDAEDIVGFENSTLTYEVGNRNKKVQIPSGAYIVKNGEALRENIADTIQNLSKGDVRIIDIDDNDSVDVVIIWEYRNIFVNSINTETYEIYDAVVNKNKVELNSDNKMVFIQDSGKNMKNFSDIKKGSLISVYESNSYVKVIINSDSTTAQVYATSVDDEKHRVQIGKSESDKTWYDIDEYFYENYLKGKSYVSEGSNAYTGDINIPIGATVTYYLDVAGNIAYISGLNFDDWTYGYLVKLVQDDSGEKAVIKVYTQNDTMKVYMCANKVKIDGVARKNYDSIKTALTKAEKYRDYEDDINGQVIRFKLNGDGEISAIDTRNFKSEKEDRLSLHYTGSQNNVGIWWHTSGFANGTHFYNGNTVIFEVPEHQYLANAKGEDFTVLPEFTDTRAYNFDTYRLDLKGADENVFVSYGGGDYLTEQGPYLVKRVYEEVDSDDTVVSKAELYNIASVDVVTVTAKEGYAFEFTANDTEYKVDKGDILFLNVNGKGKVASVDVYNDYSRMGDEDYTVATGWKNVANVRQSDMDTDLLCATAKLTQDGVTRLVYGDDTELTDEDFNESNYTKCTWAARNDIVSVLIVEGKYIRTGTPDELMTAEIVGVDNVKPCWFSTFKARLNGAVIYK